MLQRALVLQIGHKPGGAKCLAAGGNGDAPRSRHRAYQVQHIESRHRLVADPVALAYAADGWAAIQALQSSIGF